MNSRDFCYWLQGFFEISDGSSSLAPSQIETIKRHLAMVFAHEIDPSFPDHQRATLNEIHSGGTGPVKMRC